MQLFRIHRVRTRVDIDEVGTAACLRNRLGRSDKREGHRYNNIVLLHTCGHESKTQGICTAVYSNAIFRIAVLRIFPLEFVDHRTTDESRCLKRSSENRKKLR